MSPRTFCFSDTVFFDDIGHTGEPYGWAEVPDQVALGHLRDEVLPALEAEPTLCLPTWDPATSLGRVSPDSGGLADDEHRRGVGHG